MTPLIFGLLLGLVVWVMLPHLIVLVLGLVWVDRLIPFLPHPWGGVAVALVALIFVDDSARAGEFAASCGRSHEERLPQCILVLTVRGGFAPSHSGTEQLASGQNPTTDAFELGRAHGFPETAHPKAFG